jgi:hypothetical protein
LLVDENWREGPPPKIDFAFTCVSINYCVSRFQFLEYMYSPSPFKEDGLSGYSNTWGALTGARIQIKCDDRDVNLIENVRSDFCGIEHIVCVCDGCKVFISREYQIFLKGNVWSKGRWGICHKPLRMIALARNEYGDTDGPLGKCPFGAANLTPSNTGLLGDWRVKFWNSPGQ